MNLGGWSDDYKAVFDSSATLQICEALSESGQPEWKNEFIKVNNLITRTNYFFHDTLVFYHCFQYGSNGKMISGKSYLAGVNALLGTARIRTNENGHPVEISNYTAQGEPANTIKYTYDQKNRFIQFVLYNIKGKAINSHEAKYNRKNKIAEFVFRDENHQVLSTNNFIYQYDKRGNWIRAIVKISRGQEKWFIIEERSYTYYPLN
jgi:2,3-bisphosphoglycerate-independent phosphoglycerate mutase